MPFNNNYQIGVVNNPLMDSVFIASNKEGLIAPGGEAFIITEDGRFIITETGDRMITE